MIFFFAGDIEAADMAVESVFGGSEAACDNLLEVLLELLSTGGGSPSLTTFDQGVDQFFFFFGANLLFFCLQRFLHSLERDTWRNAFFCFLFFKTY